MGLFITLSIVTLLIAAISLTSFLSSKCPHCRKYRLRHKDTKVMEKVPVVISQSDSGAIVLRGEKITTHITLHCENCNEDTVYVTEKIR